MWSSQSLGSRCLVLAPMHRYNLKSNGSKGVWEVTEGVPQPPGNTELFYRESNTHWCYLGTFQLVAQDKQSIQDLGGMAKEVSASH